MPFLRSAVLLVAAVWLWLWWSAAGALADGGNGTVCLCTGSAVLLVAAVWLWLWWSAAGALADGGNGTVCLCTGPQCVPPCPAPSLPGTTTSQFPFYPQRPPSIGPFPWEQPAAPRTGFPQDPGFLAAAGACRSRNRMGEAAWLAVAVVSSAFLLLLQ